MPLVIEIDASSLIHLGERLDAAAGSVPGAAVRLIAEAAGRIGESAVGDMKEVTPVRSGRLQDSTMAESEIDGMSATVRIRQPATSLPNQDGTGGGVPYVGFVVQGRGPIRPVNKQALAGPGFGPVKYAGPAAANPYPDEATGLIRDHATEALATTAEAALAEIVGEL